MFDILNLKEKVNTYFEDIRDYSKVSSLIRGIGPDYVFHLAAQPVVSASYEDPIETISTNITGTANVLNAMRALKNNCVGIMVTSDKCYDNVEWEWGYRETDALGGRDPYSGSKGAAEIIIKSFYHSFYKKNTPVKIASVRAGNVIGGGDWALDRVVPDCMRSWSQGLPVEIRNPHSIRPWQHVLEPLSGYLSLGAFLWGNSSLNGESFNFGPVSEYLHNVEDVIKGLSQFWSFKTPLDAYTVRDNVKFHEAGLLKLNCDKSLFHLKWLPSLTYDKLIELTSLWYCSFYGNNTDMYKLTLEQVDEYEKIAKDKGLPWAQ